jgi:REP-associated tyrosine transposase
MNRALHRICTPIRKRYCWGAFHSFYRSVTLATQYNPEKHHRRSIRLAGYDYRQSGAYFVTIVTQNRICVFGDVTDEEIVLNDTGRISQASWIGLSSRFPTVSLDSFVVMPNHIHGIITVGARFIAPDSAQFIAPDSDSVQFIAPVSAPHNHVGIAREGAMNRAPTLGEIVRAFKAASTRMIRQTANPSFAWQRNYYEHIIREEESLNRIRQYILENPARWEIDRENPNSSNPEAENPWEGK